MFDLTGKIAIVTGSGKGIGKGIARCLIKAGAKVCLNCVSNRAIADETLQEMLALGGEDCAILVQADVSDYAQAEAMVKETVAKWGKVDILVNNAALQKNMDFSEYPEEFYDLLMDINLGGYINMMRACLPYLKETKGNIIFISSVHGKRPTDFDPVYGMTKGGMHMLMREAAVEFAQFGIRVNMIMPAGVQIEFKSGNPAKWKGEPVHKDVDRKTMFEKYPLYALGRTGLPDDSGYLICYMASDEAEHLTGASVRLDGGSMLK